ncbi:MAG: hypothetical protein JSS49_10760 [Planctomycetes bacterium]|nr:hypothetical protein [Planctomycetota bacterium]
MVTCGSQSRRVFPASLCMALLGGFLLVTPMLAAEDDAVEVKSTLADVVGALVEVVTDAVPANLPGATHKQTGDIKIRGVRTGHQLQTFCLNKDGLIFAVVGPPRPYGAKLEGKNNSAEIRVFDADGKELRQWTVDFAVQSIAAAPNGNIFVAGNGKIAKYDGEGKQLAAVDAPHIAALLKNADKLKEEAKAQLEDEKEQFEEQVKQFNDQADAQRKVVEEMKAALEAKPEEERTAAARKKIRTAEIAVKNLEAQAKSMKAYYRQRGERSVDDVINETTTRLKIVNALTVSDQDVFLASGVLKGYGYSIWRTDHSFEGAEQIVSGLSGCCGQMDIRCCEDGVFVAENSRKKVQQFDRDGKKLSQFGESGRNGSAGAAFGGCCNPMNLCFGSGGEVLTAESEGYIKRFTKEGSFLGVLGQARVSGGCKNVAISVSPDGEKAYFFDLQGSRIVVLTKRPDDDKATEENPEAKPGTDVEKPAAEVAPAKPAAVKAAVITPAVQLKPALRVPPIAPAKGE